MSLQVKNPMPPMTIKRHTGITSPGCPANPVSDEYCPVRLPMRSKPALQNAEIEWKKDIGTPAQPNSEQKNGSIASAPKSSNKKMALMAKLTRCTTPPSCGAEILSCRVLRCTSESFLPESAAINNAMAMTPMPPI